MVDGTKTIMVRKSRIALPVEHGTWGILLEPLVAGAVIAPSAAAPFIWLVMIGAFLLRQPLKIFITDQIAGRKLGHARIALRFILGYSVIGVAGAAGIVSKASPDIIWPFALLLPVGAFQIYHDVAKRSRELVPEITGAAAVSASAMVLALAAGWNSAAAASLWIVFLARSIPSIVYVRQRLRLEKGKDYTRIAPVILHALAFAGCGLLVYKRLIPALPLFVFGYLLIRCVTGLSENRKPMKAMQIGIREVIYGATLVLSIVIGYYTGF